MDHLLDCDHIKLGKCKLYLKHDKSELILVTFNKIYSGNTDEESMGDEDPDNPYELINEVYPIQHIHKITKCEILYFPTDRIKVNVMVSGEFTINGKIKLLDNLLYGLNRVTENENKTDPEVIFTKTSKEKCLICSNKSQTIMRCCLKCNESFMDITTEFERMMGCEEHRELIPAEAEHRGLKLCNECIKNGYNIVLKKINDKVSIYVAVKN